MELVISFSGGKDSCAMLHYLCHRYPHLKKSVVFADTGWEHPDAIPWARKITARYHLKLHVVKNTRKDFFSMVRKRKKFPSPGIRNCTSDLKLSPIYKWIRHNCSDPVIINCIGIRSEESRERKKRYKLKRNGKLTNSRRTVWDYCPIKDWTVDKVMACLTKNRIPLHPVYQYLKRFSCRVCIFMTIDDLLRVKRYDPDAFQKIALLEREINFSMNPRFFLDEL